MEALDALKRAEVLLSALVDFIEKNPVKDYSVHYDEADCDGACLADDAEIAIKDLRAVIAQSRTGRV